VRWPYSVLAALLLSVTVLAQSTAPEQPPALAENNQLRIQLVILTDKLAVCEARANTERVQYLSGEVLRAVEAQHPGWTVDWNTGGLVKKPSPTIKEK
jgi:hypothetical protein